MTINKCWIKLPNRRSLEFLKGLNSFIEIAKDMLTMKAKCVAHVKIVWIHLQFMPRYMTVGFYNHTRHGFITVRNILLRILTTFGLEENVVHQTWDVWCKRWCYARAKAYEQNIGKEGISLDPKFDALLEGAIVINRQSIR